MGEVLLHQLLENSAGQHAERTAVVEPNVGRVSYAELNGLADLIGASLRAKGVGPGDRVGIHLTKSIASLASIFGILKCGAAYVPVDSKAPAARNGFIFTDCAVRFVISRDPEGTGLESSQAQSEPFGDAEFLSDLILVPGASDKPADDTNVDANLAYILYTSGSTGLPKGVMLTHTNALAFVDWCSDEFAPNEDDRFSSHAPFHFDLSILDIYVSLKHGARLVLISEDAGRQPKTLATLIAEEKISIWYSTPSILRLLLDVKEIEEFDHSSLRIVFFAGEVFPIKHLRALIDLWPEPQYFNLYGPTETNVCTYFKVPTPLPLDRNEPVPIGAVCSGDSALVMDQSDVAVAAGEEGELYITGPSVTSGYWNLPERNAIAFFTDATGTKWYKTGDVVREDDDGFYIYISRRDRMIKRNGYRVELGEIEAALYRHDSITEAAVVAIPDQDGALSVKAFINWTGEGRPSVIKLKRFCVENLPAYMIPDRFSPQPELPKTSTDKIDYQKLKEME
jgi:amino acid adenylation domain-containing protein